MMVASSPRKGAHDGVDIIAVNLALHHVYAPAASDGSVTIWGIEPQGALKRLGELQAAPGAHCVASDDRSQLWVCDPERGSVLVLSDPLPVTSQ